MKRVYDDHGRQIIPSLAAGLGKIAMGFFITVAILQIMLLFI